AMALVVEGAVVVLADPHIGLVGAQVQQLGERSGVGLVHGVLRARCLAVLAAAGTCAGAAAGAVVLAGSVVLDGLLVLRGRRVALVLGEGTEAVPDPAAEHG